MIDPNKQPGLRVAQIFLERANFEHRPDFLSFPVGTPATADVELIFGSGLTSDLSKGRIQITVSTKSESDSLYRFSCLMTALVEADEGANFPLPDYVRTNGFAMLFPFVREVVANLTSRGRFGPIWLAPVNLVALSHATEPDTMRQATLPTPSADSE